MFSSIICSFVFNEMLINVDFWRLNGKSKILTRQVWRNNRSKITFTLHPDIVKVIKSTAEEERLPMSIVADEALYAGLKALGRMD